MINRNLMYKGNFNTSGAAPEKSRESTEILIDPSLNNVKYGAELGKRLKELGMTQKDLAAAIGTSEVTVARYLKAENYKPIKESVKKKINLALINAKHYKGYEHIDAVEFRKLFKKLWLEFNSEIGQVELTQKAGHLDQGNISELLNNNYLIFSTKVQYDFLRVFYDLCQRKAHTWFCCRPSKLAVFSDHHETATMLQNLLFGDAAGSKKTYDTDTVTDDLSVKVVEKVIDFLISMPQKAQELILSAPIAFFDSFTVPDLNHSERKYKSARDFIERFGQLSKDDRCSFYNGLQQLTSDKKVFRYWNDDRTWYLFEMNGQYLSMINSSRQRGIADPAGISFYDPENEVLRDNSLDSFRTKQDKNTDTDDQSTDNEKKKKEEQKKKHLFEAALSVFDQRCWKNCPAETVTDTIIDDIRFRLTMSPFEWHLWQLYVSYVYSVQSDNRIEALFHRGVTEQYTSAIAEHIMSLPFDEQEKIYLNPMFFFDSMALCSIGDGNKLPVFKYISALDFFIKYDDLSVEEKQRFVQKARDFRDASSEWAGYPISCDYYDNYKEIPAYGNAQTQRKAIMQFLSDFDIYTSDDAGAYEILSDLVICDITYKLNMDDEQWDVWCTVIEAVYNTAFGEPSDTSATELPDRIFEIIKKHQ